MSAKSTGGDYAKRAEVAPAARRTPRGVKGRPFPFAVLAAVAIAGLFSLASPGAARALELCSENYDAFIKFQKQKAMAYGTNKDQCYWVYRAASQREANAEVLKNCRKDSKECRLIDVFGDIKQGNTQVQNHLKQLGLYSGAIDGVAGGATRRAIIEFQRQKSVAQDGKVTNALIAQLKSATAIFAESRSSLCRRATQTMANGLGKWETREAWLPYVAEARRRGLSEADCDRELSRKTVVARTTTNPLLDKSDNWLCQMATIGVNGLSRWDSRAQYARYIREAERRNLRETDCDRLLNRRATVPASLSPEQRLEQVVKTLANSTVCLHATATGLNGLSKWNASTDWTVKLYVAEARRRGIDESKCDVELGRKKASTQVRYASYSDTAICGLSTKNEAGRSAWSTEAEQRANLEEAKRRGLSEADCDRLLGRTKDVASVPQTATPPAQKVAEKEETTPPAKVADKEETLPRPQVAIDDKSVCKLATRQLGGRLEWDAGLANHVEEARKRGLRIDSCATLLGVQQQLAALPKQVEQPRANVQSFTAVTGKRLALVIGNGAYRHSTSLPNPRNDAEAMSKLLKQMGFEVIVGVDLDKAAMEASIREFARKAPSVDLALFFYAGHGLQIGRQNYLVPIDARVEDATAVDFELLNLDQTVVKYLGGESKVGIVLLDACRDNPLARSLARSFGRTRSGEVGLGLAPIHGEGGLLVSFSTAPGEVAADGDGANSPYTAALLKHLPTAALEVELALKRVSGEVYRSTRGQQQPWHNSALREEVYLVGK